jgi:hypothetical protein
MILRNIRVTTVLCVLLGAAAGPADARFLSPDPEPADHESFNRYWYANDNPYTFFDPNGRWVCAAGSSASDCNNFEKGLDRVSASARSEKLSAPEQSALAKSAAFYGNKGDASVVVSFADLKGASGNATDKTVTLDMAATKRNTENATLHAVAKVVAHEGDHGWRIKEGSAASSPRVGLEIKAYTTQALYQKASGFMDWPGMNGWTRWGGIDPSTIEGQAKLSVLHACGTLTGCD